MPAGEIGGNELSQFLLQKGLESAPFLSRQRGLVGLEELRVAPGLRTRRLVPVVPLHPVLANPIELRLVESVADAQELENPGDAEVVGDQIVISHDKLLS